MKNWIKFVLITLQLSLSTSLLAQDDSARLAAFRLMEVSGTKEMMQVAYEQVINMQIQQNPTLAPFRNVFTEWNTQYVSYEAVKDELADVYLSYFTEAELNEMIEFFSSEVGQKTVQNMPNIMAESSAIGETTAERHLPELQRMIEVEVQRLEDMQ